MIRRRGEAPPSDSSSDEEDAFSEMSRKNAKRSKTGSSKPAATSASRSDADFQTEMPQPQKSLPVSLTSSMKRHHNPNDTRKAKMDALLQELEAEKNKIPGEQQTFVPDKKGSFVEPSEQHLTTNIFVGNLAPSVTEEDLTDLFLQFGELYSIKIMWPRTPAERSRKRNTGFVCFMNREDAEEAMEACNETDPFNVGRFLMMRWGKNVKRFVRQGTGGGIAISPTQKLADNGPIHLRSDASMEESASLHDDISARSDGMPHFIEMKPRESSTDVSKAATYQASEHQEDSIAIDSPIDMDRFHFISTVASFVAKDGSYLEKRLLKTEAGNPLFNFLSLDNASDLQRREHLFYRWRVYSFCQGDSHANWRREPFVMFHPNGRFWIPPDMNMEAARNEYTRKQDRAEGIRQRKETRQKVSKSQFLTGRQLERESQFLTGRQLERVRGSRRKGSRRGFNWDCGSKLTSEEMSQFDDLVRKRLTISRERICSAMAFCFEKSGSAREISLLLKNALLDESPLITVDMRIARLYLISDILFNSQQPGVRNAFGYRDALEKMAPQIFKSLGKHGGRNVGRMTMNKLRNAVSSVLSAWTEWSVYNPAFLDELEAAFEGREIKVTNHEQEQVQPTPEPEPEKPPEPIVEVDNTPRGGWTEVTEDAEESDGEPVDDEQTCNILGKGDSTDPKQSHDAEGDKTEATDVVHERTERRCQIRWDNNAGAASINDEIPSRNQDSAKTTPLAAGRDDLGDKQIDDVDGAAIEEEDIDGAPIVDDVDGASIDEEDIDGAPIVDDVDGAAIEEEDIDGAPIEEEAVDGSY